MALVDEALDAGNGKVVIVGDGLEDFKNGFIDFLAFVAIEAANESGALGFGPGVDVGTVCALDCLGIVVELDETGACIMFDFEGRGKAALLIGFLNVEVVEELEDDAIGEGFAFGLEKSIEEFFSFGGVFLGVESLADEGLDLEDVEGGYEELFEDERFDGIRVVIGKATIGVGTAGFVVGLAEVADEALSVAVFGEGFPFVSGDTGE